MNPLPVFPGEADSKAPARAVIEAAAEAHGGMGAYRAIDGVAVAYGGEWLNGIHRLQPVLVDRGYRSISSERYLLRGPDGAPLPHPVVGQRHSGKHGTKWVRWQGAAVPVGVAYRNRQGDPVAPHARARDVTESSALVAEAYRMFLTGPFFFLERDDREDAHTAYVSAQDAEIDGIACRQVLIRLRPGLGLSSEDRVLVAVGREDGRVRRVRFSLEGHSGTRGAVAEVLFSDWFTRGNILWPTRFLEIVVFPLNREVHRWRMTALSVKRAGGTAAGPAAATPAELTPANWSPRAGARARALPVLRTWPETHWPRKLQRDPAHPRSGPGP